MKVNDEEGASIDPYAWFDSMMNDEGESSQGRRPSYDTIQLVPEWLRKLQSSSKRNWYDPILVSIGPYHHGNPKLESLEKLKPHFARAYVERVGDPDGSIYSHVLDLVPQARLRYVEGSTDHYDDLSFGRMMFLDGCFIVQFIYWKLMQMQERMKMKNHDIAIVQRDLFLLENQLPFEVLLQFFRRNIRDIGFMREFIARTMYSSGPGRLFYRLPSAAEERAYQYHLLDLAFVRLTNPYDERKHGYARYSRRSAKDLRRVGISLRPDQVERLNVMFHTGWARGTLTLPRIDIDDTTITVLLNLVAHEHTCDLKSPIIANYICFLDSIISNADDVKELKYAGILSNFLNSDEEAAEIIREIATGLMPDDTKYFAEVKRRIENYHTHIGRTRIATWVHEVMRDYFRSPWTAIAVFYAVLAIFLSIVQTYFTVFPSPDKR